MIHFLKLEWQTMIEEKSIKKAFSFLLFYFIFFVGFTVYVGKNDNSYGFFPVLATLFFLPIIILIFETGQTNPLRRLLPSLPFTRAEIFWGRTLSKLIIWLSTLLASYLLSLALDSFLSSKPGPTAVFIAIGLSFIFLSLEHLLILLSGKTATLVRSGLSGGTMGLFISSGHVIIQTLAELFPKGYTFMAGSFLLGGILILINKTIYERRAL